jgi:hypothetical protein
MPFVLLMLAFLLYVQDPWSAPWFAMTPSEAIVATLAGMGVFALLAGFLASGVRIALRRAPHIRYEILHRFAALRRWHFVFLSAYFIVTLYVLGWGWALQAVLEQGGSPFVKPLVMTPYLVALLRRRSRRARHALARERQAVSQSIDVCQPQHSAQLHFACAASRAARTTGSLATRFSSIKAT